MHSTRIGLHIQHYLMTSVLSFLFFFCCDVCVDAIFYIIPHCWSWLMMTGWLSFSIYRWRNVGLPLYLCAFSYVLPVLNYTLMLSSSNVANIFSVVLTPLSWNRHSRFLYLHTYCENSFMSRFIWAEYFEGKSCSNELVANLWTASFALKLFQL